MPILRSASTAAFLPGWDLWRDAGIDFTPLYTEIYEPESPANRQEVLDLLDKVLFLREGGFGSECVGRGGGGARERGRGGLDMLDKICYEGRVVSKLSVRGR